MLKIKLARFGKKNQPHFRIVINEARSKRDGQYKALLGHYAPTATPKILELDLKAYKEWIAKGAQPTDTVAALAKRVESGNPFPEKARRPSKKAVAKAAAAKEAQANKTEEVTPEVVVEKTPAEVTPEVVEEIAEKPVDETTAPVVTPEPTEEKTEEAKSE